MQVLQYGITYQEVMTHTRAYRARPRSEKLSAAEAVETNPGKTMPAGEHKSLGAVLNLTGWCCTRGGSRVAISESPKFV
jgi:hypothetical protein